MGIPDHTDVPGSILLHSKMTQDTEAVAMGFTLIIRTDPLDPVLDELVRLRNKSWFRKKRYDTLINLMLEHMYKEKE